MAMKRFNIAFSAELLKIVDAAATIEYTTRSAFIRWAVIEQLRQRNDSLVVSVPIDNEVLDAAFERLRKERARRSAHRAMKQPVRYPND